MSKIVPPRIQLLLRVWAGKLERNLTDPAEATAIADLLRRLATGDDIDEIFSVWRPANAPYNPALEQRLYEMAAMRLPVKHGGEGMSYADTIALTAKRYHRSPKTIESDYSSERGKEVRAEVKAHGEFAASLGFAEKWLGRNLSDAEIAEK